MYGRTRNKAKIDAICRRMRQGKENRRLCIGAELGTRPPIYQPPELRRVVIVIDYDFGFKIDVFKLFRRKRIDSYAVKHNGNDVDNAGWSNFCKRLSNYYPRVLSPHNE